VQFLDARKRGRGRLFAGIVVALVAVIGAVLLKGVFTSHENLYSLSVISLLLAASALMAEPLMITPAVIEIILGAIAGIAGVPKTEVVDILAMIGSVFIMYMAGLEIDTRLLRRSMKGALIVGLTSFLAPTLLVFAGLRIIGYEWEESWLAAIGTATTSVAVVYAIIRRRGLARRPTGQLILQKPILNLLIG
jgi:glutathione-regulated potassium-efflux system ancillary protein KefC